MRCRDVEALWDDVHGECVASLKEAVDGHLQTCPPCQCLYEEYEGIAYCLSCLPQPEPSCDFTKVVVQHIRQLRYSSRSAPVVLTSVTTPIGLLYVGIRDERIAYVGISSGEPAAAVAERVQQRLRRPVVTGEAPAWVRNAIDGYFHTWRIAQEQVDISDLTEFEQAALRAAAEIPPGEVRSYSWVAMKIGKPKAARAVGQVMARNPLPLLLPCHRVVDASGELHQYGYGLEMKARLLEMEGYHR